MASERKTGSTQPPPQHIEVSPLIERPHPWGKFSTEDNNMWWYNCKSREWFFEETGSTQFPMKFIGSDASDGEKSTASGDGTASVGDSSSLNTIEEHAPQVFRIEEDDGTHRTHYKNMYRSGNTEPPKGIFSTDVQL